MSGNWLEQIEAVRRACREAGEPDPADEAVALALKHHGLEGAELHTEEGGFALVRDGLLTLAVAPDARDQGLGGRLAERTEGATLAWSHADHPAARALAERLGWRRVRELLVLRRPAGVPLPGLAVPDGIEIRGFRPEDRDPLLAVNAQAFADHPEQGAMDAAQFEERTAEPWFDPAGLLVATDTDGQLLGFHWTKQHDAAHGEVYVVGISPDAQGRGLGKALTLAGLHHLAGLGVDEVLLYVESDNAPALAVYRGLGFEPDEAHVQYTRS